MNETEIEEKASAFLERLDKYGPHEVMAQLELLHTGKYLSHKADDLEELNFFLWSALENSLIDCRKEQWKEKLESMGVEV